MQKNIWTCFKSARIIAFFIALIFGAKNLFLIFESSNPTKHVFPYEQYADSRYSLPQAECIHQFNPLFNSISATSDHYYRSNILITKKYISEHLEKSHGTFFHGMIVDGELYVLELPEGFQSRFLATLFDLNRAIESLSHNDDPLPDIEFLISSDDQPFEGVWCYSRRPHQESIWLIPDFGFYSWPEAFLSSFDTARKSIIRNTRSWYDRKPKLVWRGAILGLENRQSLYEKTHLKPWADVKIVQVGGETIPEDFLSPYEICNYQYAVYTEGRTYSGRMKYLLSCGSVVFAPPLNFIEFFSHLLNNGSESIYDQNFVEIDPSFDLLETNLLSLQRNVSMAVKIAQNNQMTFQKRFLTPIAVSCYWRAMIREYAKFMDFVPNTSRLNRHGYPPILFKDLVLQGKLTYGFQK